MQDLFLDLKKIPISLVMFYHGVASLISGLLFLKYGMNNNLVECLQLSSLMSKLNKNLYVNLSMRVLNAYFCSHARHQDNGLCVVFADFFFLFHAHLARKL